MDHLLRRVGLDPTLSTIMRIILQGNSQVNFPQFLGSLPCTKRSIERHFFIFFYLIIMTVIVYSSHSGSSEKYARSLSDRTGLSCFSINDEIPEGEPIVFIGWLRKDTVVGLSHVEKSRLKAVCVVGLDNDGRFRSNVVASKNGYKVPTYYLRGWIDRKKLNVLDKGVLMMVCVMMKLQGLNEQNEPIFNAMMEGGSFYDEKYLNPVELFLRR